MKSSQFLGYKIWVIFHNEMYAKRIESTDLVYDNVMYQNID